MTSEQIEIKRLTRDDAPSFYSLRLEALEREPEAFSSSPQEHRAMTPDAIAKRLGSDSEDRSFVLGASYEDRLVGMAGFFQEEGPKTRHKGRIWGVYVTQDWRRKGVARVLLSEIIRRAQARPELEQITLSVASSQTPAKQLYEALGFEVYGREARAIKNGDTYVDEDLMMLRLRR
jgi:ribosomal protein S18 acetylase RimI-like enzyme